MTEMTVPKMDDITLETVTLGSGLRLEVARKGTGQRQILLIHGYGDSWYSFSGVMQALPEDCSATALSLRGYGGSDKPLTGYALQDHADDVIALARKLGIGSAVVVGHSMGTFIAREVALRAPDLASRLVLIDTAATGNNPVLCGLAEEVAELGDQLDRNFAHAFQAGTCVKPLGGGMTLERIVDESMKAPAHVWRAALNGLIDYRPANGPFPELAELKLPVLILWGAFDEIFLRDQQDLLLAELPSAELKVFAGSGHAPNWEVPEEVAADIVAFGAR